MENLRKWLGNARKEISQIYQSEAADIRLEEFDRNRDEIVVSFLLPDKNPNKALASLKLNGRPYERVYKCVFFDDDGNVESVRIFDKARGHLH